MGEVASHVEEELFCSAAARASSGTKVQLAANELRSGRKMQASDDDNIG